MKEKEIKKMFLKKELKHIIIHCVKLKKLIDFHMYGGYG